MSDILLTRFPRRSQPTWDDFANKAHEYGLMA
jgi:hypothetical protein